MNGPIIVLIVDDETIILDCLSIYFEDEGFEVHTAVTADQALEVLAALRPHVCIADMGLDGMNGEEFILRAHSAHPHIRFILHTGSAYELSDFLRSTGMSQDDIMLKPVHDLSLFTDRIRLLASAGVHT